MTEVQKNPKVNGQKDPVPVQEEIKLNNGLGEIFYKSVLDRRSKQLDYIWETAKFSTTIIGAIYTATVALIGYFHSQDVNSLNQIAFLPFFGFIISIWAFLNIRRQYRNFLRDITCINSIEKFLGYHKEIKNEANGSWNELFIIPSEWIKSTSLNRKCFIKEKSKFGKSSMYTYLGGLFVVLALLSIIWCLQIIGFFKFLSDP